MRRVGEEATLPDIYNQIAASRGTLPVEWQSTIRATIYAHSSDSSAYVSGSPDVFKWVSRGIWRLRRPDETIAGRSEGALFGKAMAEMTIEELKSCAGDVEKLKELTEKKVADIRQRFHMD